ncbi:MAG: hypothetical protein HY343_06645, partial [Lentisphaerae bacterium]|nr:hypothetical protein [Lentisphaerota bacterium]
MKHGRPNRYWLVLLSMALSPVFSRADTHYWAVAAGTGNWSLAANWNPAQVPAAGDDVVITNGSVNVFLTNATASLNTLTLGGATTNFSRLTFSNWNTFLQASTVSVLSNGVIASAGPNLNGGITNRIAIGCVDLTVSPGGAINADAKGYCGGNTLIVGNFPGQGPGGGQGNASACSGGGYGGKGGESYGAWAGGAPYGSTNAPVSPGSGGGVRTDQGAGGSQGGHGGGVIYINASGAVSINGTVSANGGAGTVWLVGGGGSGGSVLIACSVFRGTNGVVNASGGGGTPGAGSWGGAGAGGRVSIVYDPLLQPLEPKPRVRFSANRALGVDVSGGIYSQPGTLFFPDTQMLDSGWMPHSGELRIPSLASWNVSTLTISNGYLIIPSEGGAFALTVSNDMTIAGANGWLLMTNATVDCGNTITLNQGKLSLGGFGPFGSIYAPLHSTNMPRIACAGDFILTNSGYCTLHATMTNALTPNYGALLEVGGNLAFATGTWFYLRSHSTNGGSPCIRANNLSMPVNAGFYATGYGYAGGNGRNGFGTGAGIAGAVMGGGGGYGGAGGNHGGGSGGGGVYGSSSLPLDPGSGAAGTLSAYTGGSAGGLIRVNVKERADLLGAMNA